MENRIMIEKLEIHNKACLFLQTDTCLAPWLQTSFSKSPLKLIIIFLTYSVYSKEVYSSHFYQVYNLSLLMTDAS